MYALHIVDICIGADNLHDVPGDRQNPSTEHDSELDLLAHKLSIISRMMAARKARGLMMRCWLEQAGVGYPLLGAARGRGGKRERLEGSSQSEKTPKPAKRKGR